MMYTLDSENVSYPLSPDITNLTIKLNQNELNKIDLSKLIKLTKLYCNDNNLTELPNNLPNSLIHLNCTANNLT